MRITISASGINHILLLWSVRPKDAGKGCPAEIDCPARTPSLSQIGRPLMKERERESLGEHAMLGVAWEKAEGLKTFSFSFNSLSLFLVSCPQNSMESFW